MRLNHQDTKSPREGNVKTLVPSCLGGEKFPVLPETKERLIAA
jgi:hypothetical protein